jgi:hypothetical protein
MGGVLGVFPASTRFTRPSWCLVKAPGLVEVGGRYRSTAMSEAVTTAIKALNGGLFVVGFALIGEMAVPKRFAGLFSAAPSVALANLAVIVLAKGHADAQRHATGMVVGAIAMTLACAAGVVLIGRYRARRGSLALCGLWLGFAEAGFLLVLR